MAIRTTNQRVQELLDGDWDGKRSVAPFVATASAIIDDLVAEASTPPTSTRAELMERWLAAHYYVQSDRLMTSKSTGGASGSFALGKNQTPYLDGATGLDPTGLLAALVSGETAGTAWLGKTDPEKLSYDDRN